MSSLHTRRRVLVLTPWAPFPITGACQQDRVAGLEQMVALGYDVRVIAKLHDFQNPDEVKQGFSRLGIPAVLSPHLKRPWGLLLSSWIKEPWNLGIFDGAALEYRDPVYQDLVLSEIQRHRPDVLWIEYTTHWPLLQILKSLNIPVIFKSSLHEPGNCVDEHGGSLISRLKSLPKYVGERKVANNASMVLAITPDEERWYQSLGAKKTGVLPLRGLSKCFTEKVHGKKSPLDVVFLSSNYNMGHNRDALKLLLQKIIPLVQKKLPGAFRFHITGRKFPERWKSFLGPDTVLHGFVPDLPVLLSEMDIALCPWISGRGMQQKVFEPLCRSIPLLTTKTAGYPFEDGTDVILCSSPEDYVKGLQSLLSYEKRNTLSKAGYTKAMRLFSAETVASIQQKAIQETVEHKI